VCGSFWDLRACRQDFVYDRAYPAARGHHDTDIGSQKIRTLRQWLSHLPRSPERGTVCEVGFGGAHGLADLAARGAHVFGIETIPDNISQAARLGIARDRLFLFDQLPDGLPSKINLWLFQDSFEHLKNPQAVLKWMEPNSAADCFVLMVLPEAGSLSERTWGALWPHLMPDHCFHWSQKGIVSLMASHGFSLVARFNPVKVVSMATIVSHLGSKFPNLIGARLRNLIGRKIEFKFNLGEMGLIFSKI
jgi:hypothetical protein